VFVEISDFETSPVGRLVKIAGFDHRLNAEYDHWAFVPEPLPETLVLTNETHALVARAERSIGRLQEALLRFPNPRMLLQTSLKREAQSTSALEGTYAPLTSIFEGEFVGASNMDSNVREIMNYIEAANRGLRLIKEKPIHMKMLSELQGLIVEKTEGGNSSPGEIRRTPVIIGERAGSVESARFVPPPAGPDLERSYSDWEKWINSTHDFSNLILIALGHYQFETIHPYNDGNGRLGRLIVSLQFVTHELLDPPVLNLSSYFNERKDEYKDQLLSLSQSGDFDTWVQFFMKAVIDQSEIEIVRMGKLLDFVAVMQASIKNSGGRGVITEIPYLLLANPYFTVSSLAEKLKVTYPAAGAAITKLIGLGFLREITIKNSRKLVVCEEIIRILNPAGN
jgi:Fic family protein